MRSGKKAYRSQLIKAIERQYQVAEMAASVLESALKKDPSLLTRRQLKTLDLREYQSSLLNTYFIRLFAEFETALRDFWRNGEKQDSIIRARDLINSLATRYRVRDVIRDRMHAARRWRNHLVHEEEADAQPVALAEARRAMGHFLGYLPDDW